MYLYAYIKIHQIVHMKYAQFITSKFIMMKQWKTMGLSEIIGKWNQ